MDYKEIFIKKEFKSLIGVRHKNLLICAALLFISVFTISLSLGAYDQLKERMDNPFTNWVTMPVLYQYRENLPMLQEDFRKNENLSKYQLRNISGFVKWTFKVMDPTTNKIKDITGRTLEYSDAIAEKIFENQNIVSISDSFSIQSQDNLFKLFITLDFCKDLGIDPENCVGKKLMVKDFEDNYILMFDIGGVLKSLPNHSKFVMSQDFFNMFREKYETTGFIDLKDGTKVSLISNEIISKNDINNVLGGLGVIDYDTLGVSVAGADKKIVTNIFTANFISDSTAVALKSLINKSDESASLLREWQPIYNFSELPEPMYFSFNFSDLSKIKELQNYLKETYNMEIELSIVEERDNFSMVSKLTFFMILSLIVVSMISFSIFLFNLIQNHLDKIKPNIGTFMAFGFSAKSIGYIYTISVIRFMLQAWIMVGLILSILWGLGYVTGWFLLDIFNPVVVATFLLFNLLAYILTKRITTKILFETPGDLIYGRV